MNLLFDTLGSQSEDRDLAGAEGAFFWKALLTQAVVAANEVMVAAIASHGGSMIDHAGIALIALHDPSTATVRAGDVAGIPSSVEQQDRLIPLFGGLLKCLGKAWSQQMDATILPTALFLGKVDDVDLWQRKTRCSLWKPVNGDPIQIDGVVPGLQ